MSLSAGTPVTVELRPVLPSSLCRAATAEAEHGRNFLWVDLVEDRLPDLAGEIMLFEPMAKLKQEPDTASILS